MVTAMHAWILLLYMFNQAGYACICMLYKRVYECCALILGLFSYGKQFVCTIRSYKIRTYGLTFILEPCWIALSYLYTIFFRVKRTAAGGRIYSNTLMSITISERNPYIHTNTLYTFTNGHVFGVRVQCICMYDVHIYHRYGNGKEACKSYERGRSYIKNGWEREQLYLLIVCVCVCVRVCAYTVYIWVRIHFALLSPHSKYSFCLSTFIYLFFLLHTFWIWQSMYCNRSVVLSFSFLPYRKKKTDWIDSNDLKNLDPIGKKLTAWFWCD